MFTLRSRVSMRLTKVAAFVFGLSMCATSAFAGDNLHGPLIIKQQGSFFVGGQIIHTPAASGTLGGPSFFGGTNADNIAVNQMYVQFQIPEGNDHIPVVMLHGCCLSGKTWETTPDGRMGWNEYFLRQGRPVYIPDQVSRARSGFDATTINEVLLGKLPPSALPNIFVIGQNVGWELFRFGPTPGTPFGDEQFPVAAANEFAKQVIPDLNALLPANNPTWTNLSALATQLNGAILMGHSESGFFPQEAALINPSGIRGIVEIEGMCPAQTSQQIAKLAKIPTLIIFGDHLYDVQPVWKSFWSGIYSDCQTLVHQVKAAGGDITLMYLPQMGIHGNSHMMMQDKNNLQLADLILNWIDEHVEKGSRH